MEGRGRPLVFLNVDLSAVSDQGESGISCLQIFLVSDWFPELQAEVDIAIRTA